MRGDGLLRLVLTILLLGAWGASAQAARGQQAAPAPKVSELMAVVYNGDMANLLNRLADAYGVVIGFEAESARPRPVVNINVRDATVQVWGEVVYQVPEMGFALRFLEHDSETQRRALARLIERLRGEQTERACA